MGILSDKLKSGVVGESLRSSSGTTRTIAKVIDADESTNLCTIEYADNSGRLTERQKVAVDFRNTEWFPEKGEIVLADTSSSSAVVVSKYTENYAKDVRGKEKLENDILADEDGTCLAGSIL